MITPVRIHRDQHGLIGKMIVVWLIVVVLVGIVAIDTVSIAITKFKEADLASAAAATAANTWRDTQSEQRACNAARATVLASDPDGFVPRDGCVVNQATGQVTVTIRKTATTLVAALLPWTRKLAHPQSTETAGPTVL